LTKKKSPADDRAPRKILGKTFLLSLYHICSLWPFLTIDNLELDRVALLQAFVTLRNQGTVVYEYVRAIVTTDKAEALCIVEPFYGSFQFHFLFLPGTNDPQESSRVPSLNCVKQFKASEPVSIEMVFRLALADPGFAASTACSDCLGNSWCCQWSIH
jgi:hypothetical protein